LKNFRKVVTEMKKGTKIRIAAAGILALAALLLSIESKKEKGRWS
jgi:hypothetical protein